MNDNSTVQRKTSRIGFHALIQALGWTLFLALFLSWSLYHHTQEINDIALCVAQTHIEKVITYRQWSAMHGGVYVPATEKTPPNPYLLPSLTPERDIITPSGRKLTLLNPAYMTRQIFELTAQENKIRGHITSLNPIRPENKADTWENKALHAFEDGKKFVSELMTINGAEYLRLMRPLITKKGCLKCHAEQGYQVGDIRGGLSVMLPMAPLKEALQHHINTIWIGHAILWLLGLLGISFSFIGLRKRATERDRAEEALRESEEHFRQLYEDAPLAYQSLDEEGVIIEVNQTWLNSLGYTRKEVIGRPVLDFLAPQYHARLKENFPKFKEQGEVHGVEFEFVRKDGSRLMITVDGKISHDAEGNFQKTHCILTDITESRRAEKALRRYEHIVSATHDIMSFVDKNYVYQAVNDSLLRMFKKQRDEVIGHTVAELVGQELFDNNMKDKLDKALTGHQIQYEMWMDFPELKNQYLEIVYSPYFEEDKSVSGVVASSRNITRRKRMEEDLRQAQKMEAIGTLAGGIAHDFNNILSAIQGYTELSLLETPPDHKNYENLQEVASASKRAADLVKQILTFSRRAEKEKKPLLLHPVLKESIKLIRGSLPTTIEIQQNISTDCDPVNADVTQMHQVIMNLVTNSYHAMRESGGVLKISLQQSEFDNKSAANIPDLKPGKYVHLSISDTGEGIEKNILARIFDPYFTTKSHGEGTGLGLAVVHGIVKDHGGVITVKSQPGRGTAFDVYLPTILKEAHLEGSVPKIDLDKISCRVLLVDDEEAIVHLAEKILKKIGCEVTSFTDSLSAFKAFQKQPDNFDLIITDQTMPNLTGLEMSKKIRAIRSDIPIILATGYSELVNEQKAKDAGIQKFFMKPFTVNDLITVTKQVIDSK